MEIKNTMSNPELFMSALLLQITDAENIETQYTPRWACGDGVSAKSKGTKKYDFYVKSINSIIEVHGLQHYVDVPVWTVTGEDAAYNDAFKEKLAIDNGINKYTQIDCRVSSVDYMFDSCMKNKDFTDLLSEINLNWKSKINKSLINQTILKNKEYSDEIINTYKEINKNAVIYSADEVVAILQGRGYIRTEGYIKFVLSLAESEGLIKTYNKKTLEENRKKYVVKQFKNGKPVRQIAKDLGHERLGTILNDIEEEILLNKNNTIDCDAEEKHKLYKLIDEKVKEIGTSTGVIDLLHKETGNEQLMRLYFRRMAKYISLFKSGELEDMCEKHYLDNSTKIIPFSTAGLCEKHKLDINVIYQMRKMDEEIEDLFARFETMNGRLVDLEGSPLEVLVKVALTEQEYSFVKERQQITDILKSMCEKYPMSLKGLAGTNSYNSLVVMEEVQAAIKKAKCSTIDMDEIFKYTMDEFFEKVNGETVSTRDIADAFNVDLLTINKNNYICSYLYYSNAINWYKKMGNLKSNIGVAALTFGSGPTEGKSGYNFMITAGPKLHEKVTREIEKIDSVAIELIDAYYEKNKEDVYSLDMLSLQYGGPVEKNAFVLKHYLQKTVDSLGLYTKQTQVEVEKEIFGGTCNPSERRSLLLKEVLQNEVTNRSQIVMLDISEHYKNKPDELYPYKALVQKHGLIFTSNKDAIKFYANKSIPALRKAGVPMNVKNVSSVLFGGHRSGVVKEALGQNTKDKGER